MIVHYAELRYSGSLVSNVSEQEDIEEERE